MKNLQDIINKMSNSSKEIAAELYDEGIEILEVSPLEDSFVLGEDKSGKCEPYDYRTVPFCCAINLPGNFKPEESIYNCINPIIAYDLSYLKIIIDESCTCATVNTCKHGYDEKVFIPSYDIKVVGCIPFIINIELENKHYDKICVTSSKGYVKQPIYACCSGNVCVDTTLGSVCSQKQALIACDFKLDCKNVEVEFEKVSYHHKDCSVLVKGKFKFPNIKYNHK